MTAWRVDGYTEIEVLGEGGFGKVVLARHDASGGFVAIKYLHPRYLTNPQVMAGFRQEAWLLAGVDGPNVVRLYDFVETPHGAALVMEAVAGVSLTSVLADESRLPPEAALAVLKGALSGLSAAHRAGVVHRDFNPDTVLVSPDGETKVVGFGLAALSGPTAGSAAYMAPERWAGEPPTAVTDVYAATCVLFQCVTGRRPYSAETADDLRVLHQDAPIPFAEAPESVRGLIAHGMAKAPSHRPPTASVFVAELEQTARTAYGPDWEERGLRLLAPHVAALVATTPVATLAAVTPTTGSGSFRTTLVKVAAGLVAVAVVVGGAAVVYNQVDEPPEHPRQVATRAVIAGVQARTGERSVDVDMSVQYVRLASHPDPGVRDQIDNALRAPVNDRIHLAESGDENRFGQGAAHKSTTSATIARQTERYLSVRYDSTVTETESPLADVDTVNVDLQNGRELGANDIFREEVLTDGGMDELQKKLVDNVEDGNGWCPTDAADPITVRAFQSNSTDGERAVDVGFTDVGVQFVADLAALGFPDECDGRKTSTIPYGEAGELLKPSLLADLRVDAVAPSTTPTTSPKTTEARATTTSKPKPKKSTLDGQRFAMGRLTVTLPRGWQYRPQGLENVGIAKGCPDADEYFDCPRFLMTDNTKSSAQQPVYKPGRHYVRSAAGRACNAIGDNKLKQAGETKRVRHKEFEVDSNPVVSETWRVQCVKPGNGTRKGRTLTQRVWYFPKQKAVFLDEWNLPAMNDIIRGVRSR